MFPFDSNIRVPAQPNIGMLVKSTLNYIFFDFDWFGSCNQCKLCSFETAQSNFINIFTKQFLKIFQLPHQCVLQSKAIFTHSCYILKSTNMHQWIPLILMLTALIQIVLDHQFNFLRIRSFFSFSRHNIFNIFLNNLNCRKLFPRKE